MRPRPIALLTDFGTGDPYVAAMKGVILTKLPDASIVDITHDIPRHDVRSAAYTLDCVERYLPPRSVIVCVVDPGVGTRRKIILLERNGRSILAPDNGLLELVAEGGKGERWRALRAPQARGLSSTFHGRDVFAPAAARLAVGVRAESLADAVPARRSKALYAEAPKRNSGTVKATVLHVDYFGNIITNVRIAVGVEGEWQARISGTTVPGPFRTYEEAPARRPFLLRGSSGLVEVSVRRGDAAKLLRARPGTLLTFKIR